jgi:DNA-binding transcriptional MerR regulator
MYHIGTVAKRTGLSIDTIRFYEKIELIKLDGRSSSGYRLFTDDHLRTLKFVIDSQKMGFSLSEIKELLALRSSAASACENVRDMIEKKLSQVRHKLEYFHTLECQLARDLDECNRQLQRRTSRMQRSCPVLEKIAVGY